MEAFLVKYNTNRELLWTKLIRTSGIDVGRNVAVDQNRNIYVTGFTNRNLNRITNNCGDDAFLVKYNPNGELLWTY